VDAADGTGEEFGNGENGQIGEAFMIGQGDRVGDNNLFDGRSTQTLDGGARGDAVGDATVDITRTALMDDAHRLRERTGGINLLVNNQGVFTFDASDNVLGFTHAVVAETAFLDNGKGSVKAVCQFTRLLGEPFISGNDSEIVQFFLDEIASLDDLCGQFVNGNIEKALNLTGVHVHCQHAVRTGNGDTVGNKASCDGNARLIFLIRAPIGIIGKKNKNKRKNKK